MNNLIDYRQAKFPTVGVCSNCNFIFPIKWSIACSNATCRSCGNLDVMLQMTPKMLHIKKLWEQHWRKSQNNFLTVNREAFLRP